MDMKRGITKVAVPIVLAALLYAGAHAAIDSIGAPADQAGAGGKSYRVEWENTVAMRLPRVPGVPESFVYAPGHDQRPPLGVCAARLSDKGTRRVLTLVRSESKRLQVIRGDSTLIAHESWGDYVPAKRGEYGLGRDEALRVDCGPNSPIGRVKLDLSNPRGLPGARASE